MGNPRPITDAEDAIIRQMLEAGATIDAIAARLKRGAPMVSRYSIAAGYREPGAQRSEWNDERVQQMKGLFDAGLSASKIAAALGGGVSRNAVIGKCGRMGWTRELPSAKHRVQHGMATRNRREGVRPQRPAKPRKPKANNFVAVNAARRILTYAAHPRGVPLPKVEFAPIVIDATHAKPWLERAFGECAYPIAGEGADTFSCCAPCGDRNYCPSHRAVMFTPPKDPPSAFARLARRAA